MTQTRGTGTRDFTTKGRLLRRIAVSSAIAIATLGVPLAGSAAHAQDPACIVNGRQLHVVETYDRFVDARSINNPIAELYPSGAINVSYLSGTVWSGTWFTTPNGPSGWTNWPAPSSGYWSAPGVNLFSLVGQIYPYVDNTIIFGHSYHAAWAPQWCIHLDGYGLYDMAVNDDYRNDDTGGFWVRVQVLGR